MRKISGSPPTSCSTPEPMAKAGLKERVQSMLWAQGIPTHTPCLKLEVQSGSERAFAMNEEDVLRVFSKFGKVRSLRVLDSVALVLFEEITPAYFAQKILDGRKMGDLQINLQVSWYHNRDPPAETKAVEPQAAVKYTCQFDIQILNDKEFQVARRLIGPKGNNMKRIVAKCSKKAPGLAHDIVKIRLRGKGSGFKEGPERKESDEPLHLCVSSKYENKYSMALRHIEKLLNKIYKDYAAFCAKKNWTVRHLEVSKVEHVTGKLSNASVQRLNELSQLKLLNEPEVKELVGIRNEARRQCNFEQADRIRELLRERGIVLIDEKGARGKGGEVTTWKHLN